MTSLCPVASGQVTFNWVTIGDPGNPTDPYTNSTYGSVAYEFDMATTEVTHAQYVDFLNSVAASDPYALFNGLMETNPRGGIRRVGDSGAYVYSCIPGRENHPVMFVSFLDAMRFVNWLHNGQGSGDTETGAYTLGTGLSETRNPGATFFIPTEDEWYKASYYQPVTSGGDTDSYWLYPISANEMTTADANYAAAVGDTTPVGSYPANANGVYDLAGNAKEWNETYGFMNLTRGISGGSWGNVQFDLQSLSRFFVLPTQENNTNGIRVARPAAASCLADVNGDGAATPADFNAWILAFNGQAPGCDQNGDGQCTPADFNAWIVNYNAGC